MFLTSMFLSLYLSLKAIKIFPPVRNKKIFFKEQEVKKSYILYLQVAISIRCIIKHRKSET